MARRARALGRHDHNDRPDYHYGPAPSCRLACPYAVNRLAQLGLYPARRLTSEDAGVTVLKTPSAKGSLASMSHDMKAETITIAGHGGDQIEAYLAQPLGHGPFGGVVVIHHMPGYDRSTKEIARRFADEGYIALMPNLYSR